MEQTVDMETGEVLAVAVQTMAGGGTASSPVMLEASERVWIGWGWRPGRW